VTTDCRPAHSRMWFEQPHRHHKTYLRCSGVVGPLLGERPYATGRIAMAHQAIRILFWRHCNLFSAADESLFKRVLQNELHVLQPLLPAKTSYSYNLRPRYHNRQLTRTSALLTSMTHVLLLECSTLTHRPINCYYSLIYFYCFVALCDVAICQLFYTNIHTHI